MTNETRAVDDLRLLSAWAIHFSFAGCTTSVLRGNLENPSNIYFWENTSLDERKLTAYIYILTQIILCKDIKTLRQIILEPEEIHKLVKQMETLQESLKECVELEETKILIENGKIPEVKCNIIDGKCVSVDLLITDQFDPDHNLRCLLRDLQTYSKTVTRNITRRIESKEKQSPPVTQRKSRKRKANCLDRNGKIPKMKTIDTYLIKEPKRTEGKRSSRKDQELNGKCSSREVEIIWIDDDDSDSSHQVKENELRENHVDKEVKTSINRKSRFLETACDPDDEICIVAEKTRTPALTATEKKATDTDVCVTQDCHARRITRLSVSKREKLEKNCTKVNFTNSCNNETNANANGTDNDINTDANPSKNDFELDAVIREVIRDWCGGETFLTQESLLNSGEVTERNDGMNDKAGNKHYDTNNNNKYNQIDTGDNDNDDDNVDDGDDSNDEEEEEDDDNDDDDYIYDSEEESDSDRNDYTDNKNKTSSKSKHKGVRRKYVQR